MHEIFQNFFFLPSPLIWFKISLWFPWWSPFDRSMSGSGTFRPKREAYYRKSSFFFADRLVSSGEQSSAAPLENALSSYQRYPIPPNSEFRANIFDAKIFSNFVRDISTTIFLDFLSLSEFPLGFRRFLTILIFSVTVIIHIWHRLPASNSRFRMSLEILPQFRHLLGKTPISL